MSDERFGRDDPNPIALDALDIPEYDPRDFRSDDDLRRVKNSMEENGQLKPIQVDKTGEQPYDVVDGNHRMIAADRLGWSRIDHIPLSESWDPEEAAIVAGTARIEFSNADKLDAIYGLYDRTDKTMEEVGDRLGVSTVTVSRYVKVAEGYGEIRRLFEEEGLQLKAAAKLNSIPDRDRAVAIAEKALKEGWNQQQIVSQATSAAAAMKAGESDPTAEQAVTEKQVRDQVREAQQRQEAAREQATVPSPGSPEGHAQAAPEADESARETIDPTNEDICHVCGKDTDNHASRWEVTDQEVQEQIGFRDLSFCHECSQAVFSGITALQEQTPAPTETAD